ncbi:hypothetical protein RIF29_10754 [Crotalaria pallida]|uniref:Uncharacterized protein n=1 Tax=Crotalaria pallida TaxID=3830 RepID=A0AAN9FT62_CROPI
MEYSSYVPPTKRTEARANRYSDADYYLSAACNAREYWFNGCDYGQVRWCLVSFGLLHQQGMTKHPSSGIWYWKEDLPQDVGDQPAAQDEEHQEDLPQDVGDDLK